MKKLLSLLVLIGTSTTCFSAARMNKRQAPITTVLKDSLKALHDKLEGKTVTLSKDLINDRGKVEAEELRLGAEDIRATTRLNFKSGSAEQKKAERSALLREMLADLIEEAPATKAIKISFKNTNKLLDFAVRKAEVNARLLQEVSLQLEDQEQENKEKGVMLHSRRKKPTKAMSLKVMSKKDIEPSQDEDEESSQIAQKETTRSSNPIRRSSDQAPVTLTVAAQEDDEKPSQEEGEESSQAAQQETRRSSNSLYRSPQQKPVTLTVTAEEIYVQ